MHRNDAGKDKPVGDPCAIKSALKFWAHSVPNSPDRCSKATAVLARPGQVEAGMPYPILHVISTTMHERLNMLKSAWQRLLPRSTGGDAVRKAVATPWASA